MKRFDTTDNWVILKKIRELRRDSTETLLDYYDRAIKLIEKYNGSIDEKMKYEFITNGLSFRNQAILRVKRTQFYQLQDEFYVMQESENIFLQTPKKWTEQGTKNPNSFEKGTKNSNFPDRQWNKKFENEPFRKDNRKFENNKSNTDTYKTWNRTEQTESKNWKNNSNDNDKNRNDKYESRAKFVDKQTRNDKGYSNRNQKHDVPQKPLHTLRSNRNNFIYIDIKVNDVLTHA